MMALSEDDNSSVNLSLKLRRGSSDSRESYYMDFDKGIDSDIEEVSSCYDPRSSTIVGATPIKEDPTKCISSSSNEDNESSQLKKSDEELIHVKDNGDINEIKQEKSSQMISVNEVINDKHHHKRHDKESTNKHHSHHHHHHRDKHKSLHSNGDIKIDSKDPLHHLNKNDFDILRHVDDHHFKHKPDVFRKYYSRSLELREVKDKKLNPKRSAF